MILCIKLPWEGPESCCGTGGRTVGTLETDYSLGIAVGQKLIRPDAGVALVVVGETGVAGGLVRHPVGALGVRRAARIAVRVNSKLVLAPGCAYRHDFLKIFIKIISKKL